MFYLFKELLIWYFLPWSLLAVYSVFRGWLIWKHLLTGYRNIMLSLWDGKKAKLRYANYGLGSAEYSWSEFRFKRIKVENGIVFHLFILKYWRAGSVLKFLKDLCPVRFRVAFFPFLVVQVSRFSHLHLLFGCQQAILILIQLFTNGKLHTCPEWVRERDFLLFPLKGWAAGVLPWDSSSRNQECTSVHSIFHRGKMFYGRN